MIRLYILSVLLVLSSIICIQGSRHISCHVNPGMNASTQERSPMNVVHIISVGDNDVVHFVWSTYKVPSVIVARTSKNITLLINSTKLISFENDAITLKDGTPFEAVGVTFSKLWELSYKKDSSPINDEHSAEDLPMESLDWNDIGKTLRCSDGFASVSLKANNSELMFFKDGTFEIQFSVSGSQKLSDEFPHLVYTGNSTLLKFVLDNLYSNSSCARYGFGISLFSVLSNECVNDTWKSVITKSINDEVSPGVFSSVELPGPCSVKNEESTYLSWRPVAYTGIVPIIANSSDVTMMSDPQPSEETSIQSIAELYFQGKSNRSVFNITFGTPGDGCYAATKYTTWSLMIGTGSPIEIPLSSIIIILASAGVGLLMLFLLTGSIFMLYRRCKDKDDDLLLN